MRRLERVLLPLLLAAWWLTVKWTKATIFPSPLDVAKGIVTLAERQHQV